MYFSVPHTFLMSLWLLHESTSMWLNLMRSTGQVFTFWRYNKSMWLSSNHILTLMRLYMHLYTAVLFPDLTHIATTTSEMCTEYDIDILQVSFTHFTESFYIKFWNKAQGTVPRGALNRQCRLGTQKHTSADCTLWIHSLASQSLAREISESIHKLALH